MPDESSVLQPQYNTPDQQHETAIFGMWVFLATEILLFGGMFTALTMYRVIHPQAFVVASHHLNLALGTINTAVLLSSSLTMALGVRTAQLGKREATIGYLLATVLLGLIFLALKFLEYYQHWQGGLLPGPWFHVDAPEPQVIQLFMVFYFVMTGLHALHLTIGCGLMVVLAGLTYLRKFSAAYHTPIQVGGLYWHLVDIVWIFLYPLFYLIGHH